MGIMSNTISMYQYEVGGTPAAEKTVSVEWIQDRLEYGRFEPITDPSTSESVGWVHFDDPNDSDFSNINSFNIDHYLAFTLRRDVRKVPGALLKNMVEKACGEWLQERPNLRKVPKSRKQEIKDNIQAALLAKSLPQPSMVDVLWDTVRNIVTVASTSTSVLDFVENEFARTFDGLHLVPIHPIRRAQRVLSGEYLFSLETANKATSSEVLSQISSNKWLGWDFLLWLMYQSAQGGSEYEIDQAGPLDIERSFVAFPDDRFVLTENTDGQKGKSSIVGPQKDNYSESCIAVRNGKKISEATIRLQYGARIWKLTLKGEIFAFNSFTCPPVLIERDGTTDPRMDLEATFLERMSQMESGLQLFDSLLSTFLQVRLDEVRWSRERDRIINWVVDHAPYQE